MPFYRNLRPLFFLLPPELAHWLMVHLLKGLAFARLHALRDDYILTTKAMGVVFPNPFGIAAGFDKNGEVMDGVLKIGFGFSEIGTVTPQAQPGNPRPRLFRLPEYDALINRMGFNNHGYEIVRQRLLDWRAGQKNAQGVANGSHAIVGVNIGAGRNSADPIADYISGAGLFANHADYLTLNISSPNTPGLRDLQQIAPLTKIVKGVCKAVPQTPILLKLSPDLDDESLQDIAALALKQNIAGLIIGNTTTDHSSVAGSRHAGEAGGLSGAPLQARTIAMLANMRQLTQGKILLIGCGGIANAEHAYAAIRAGASLLQLYTALVFQGPGVIGRLKRELAELLRADGFSNITQAVGADVPLTPSVRKKQLARKAPFGKTGSGQASSGRKKKTANSTKESKMSVTIYHNPRCSKSRASLALLEKKRLPVKVVEYLKTPPDKATLQTLLKKLKMPPADLLRKSEAVYKELKLDKVSSDTKLIAAMVAHPILIERPIIVKGRKAVIGRPPENILTIL